MARSFLTTYRPLCRTRKGREAIQRHAQQPFVDGSCRREPDLESPNAAITALCRGRMFAPRLRVGDQVAYVTKKGRYGEHQRSHWRLVALLSVIERFASHDDAALWYRERALGVPRNCITSGSLPLDLELTRRRVTETTSSASAPTFARTYRSDLGRRIQGAGEGKRSGPRMPHCIHEPVIAACHMGKRLPRLVRANARYPNASSNQRRGVGTLEACRKDQLTCY